MEIGGYLQSALIFGMLPLNFVIQFIIVGLMSDSSDTRRITFLLSSSIIPALIAGLVGALAKLRRFKLLRFVAISTALSFWLTYSSCIHVVENGVGRFGC